jgi:hypothetical protein
MGVPKIKEAEKPTFDGATYSDRLQETRLADGALPAVQVFDKTKPSSIVPLARYVKDKLTDTVNSLCQFTNDIKNDLDNVKENQATINSNQNQRLAAIEAQLSNTPFPG